MYPFQKKKKELHSPSMQEGRTQTHAQICIQLERALNDYIALEVQYLFTSFRAIPAALVSQTNNTAGTNIRCLTYGCNDYVGCRESYISEL